MGSASAASPSRDAGATSAARVDLAAPAERLRARATLRRSADRKVTNLPSPNGKTAKIANSFGLPAGSAHSCPGATATCERVCYAGKLEKLYKGVREVLVDNLEALTGRDRAGMALLIAEMIDDFREDCERTERRGAVVPRDFRIHWDGDFFSLDYAGAWADVVRADPDIRFWVYTRSFNPEQLDVLPVLAGLSNFTVCRRRLKTAPRSTGEFRGGFAWSSQL